MTKLNKIYIKGLRGVRNDLSLELKGKSILLYGDNGSGKSTISDVIEWFYYDRIDHLADNEIGRKGHAAIRNTHLNDNDPGFVSLELSKSNYNNQKSIAIDNGSLKSESSNDSDEFAEYLSSSQQDNLILRYRDLVEFVLFSRDEKLRALSNIIGYSRVTHTRDTLRTVYGRLTKEININNFDNLINARQGEIISQIGTNVETDKEYIKEVNSIIKPFKLDIKVEKLADIDNVLAAINTPKDNKDARQEIFLSDIHASLVNIPKNINDLETYYEDFKTKFNSIISDIDKLNKLSLENLLSVGSKILSAETYNEDKCPLCLSSKNKEILFAEISKRITELGAIKSEKKKLLESQQALKQQITAIVDPLETALEKDQINEKENDKLRIDIKALLKAVVKYQEQSIKPLTEKNIAEDSNKLLIADSVVKNLIDSCVVKLIKIRDGKKVNTKLDASVKIQITYSAYTQVKKLTEARETFEKQRKSLEIIYKSFLVKQKVSLELFLNTFSQKINKVYQFLNPDENIENIKLIPIEANDELSGITIQFDFLDEKEITPPHKYLSESHVNSLGLAFFFASVEAFNKQNKFIILDDVISSFDADHRKRFADLLIEKFDNYQIVLLTHEKTWFHMVKNLVQNQNWIIESIKHSNVKGTYIDEAPQVLRERIEKKIEESDENGLGNDVRKYTENTLKNIANNCGVKLVFRFNNLNEDRMTNELLAQLKSTIKKRKCDELIPDPIIDRLLGSAFIATKESHDNSTTFGFSDIKACWRDVLDLEKLFYCDECNSALSIQNYNKLKKQIQCKCGKLIYPWSI